MYPRSFSAGLDLSVREMREGRLLAFDDLPRRPKTRGDCLGGPRPCPWVSCRHHLYLHVSSIGTLFLPFHGLDPDQLAETCSLDVADRGGETLENVGTILNITREMVRQLEIRSMIGARFRFQEVGIEEFPDFPTHPLADIQGPEVYGSSAINLAGKRLTAEWEVERAVLAMDEEARLERVARLGHLVDPRSFPVRTSRATANKNEEDPVALRSSKMDALEGKARKEVEAALLDVDVTAYELYETLEGLGVVKAHELTISGIGYYLRTRRAALLGAAIELESVVKQDVLPLKTKEISRERTLPVLSSSFSGGYVILTGGEIWTASPDAALEIRRRILGVK